MIVVPTEKCVLLDICDKAQQDVILKPVFKINIKN
jgi:hypothetical protein